MYSALPLIALGLVAPALAATPNSYSAWVDLFPSCAQPCFDTMFTDLIGDSCGSNAKTSTSDKDISCICTTGNFSDGYDAGQEAGQCYVNNCGTDVDISELTDDLSQLLEMCYKVTTGDSNDSSSSSSSSSTEANAAAAQSMNIPMLSAAVVLGALFL